MTSETPTDSEKLVSANSKQATEPKEQAYRAIWSRLPERQNGASSAWWFFLLFPEGEDGYGPRQLMFTIAARVGERMNIAGLEVAGIDRTQAIDTANERFPAVAVGWYCDGQQVYEDYVKESAVANLTYASKTINCLSGTYGDQFGVSISASPAYPLAMETTIAGRDHRAHFTAWGDLDAAHTSPDKTMDIHTPFGGVHYVALRKLHFDGEFDLPTGRERLRGLGFFQRVALNVPVFPWKWIYALFPDGSLFTAYVPYVGLNLLRKGYRFFGSNGLEQAALPVAQSAVFFPAGEPEPIRFNRVIARPHLDLGPHPQFEVEARNSQGDSLTFLAASYGHARFYIDRPILGGAVESHWSYNEYIFRMEKLGGTIRGRAISNATMGQGYGNFEYTWGLGL